MDQQTKSNLANDGIWIRLIYMILFVLAYAVAEAVLGLVVVFQWFAALITGSVNKPLHDFSANLSRYIYDILQFQTFNTEDKAFPFSDWPDVAPGSGPWSGDQGSAAVPSDGSDQVEEGADEVRSPADEDDPDSGLESDPEKPNA